VENGLELLGQVARGLGESIPKSKLVLRLRLFWNTFKLRFLRVPSVETLTPKEDRRLELFNSIGFRLTLEDYELGTLFRFRYFYLALKSGSRVHVANGLSLVAGMPSLMPRWLAGGVRRSEELIAAGQRLLHDDDPILTRGMFLYASSMVDFSEGRWRAHRQALERVAELGHDKRAVGLHWSTAFVESAITALLWIEGNVVELRSRLPDFTLGSRGYRSIEAMHALVGATTLSLCDDQPDTARRLAAQNSKSWPTTTWRVQHHLALVARTEADLYEGRAAAAWETLRTSWPRSKASGFFNISFYRLTALFLRARVALAAGYLPPADRDISYLLSRPDGWAVAAARAFEACAWVQRGRPDLAAPLLEDAAKDLEQWDLSLYASAARWRLAELAGDAAAKAAVGELLFCQGIRNPDRFVRFLLPFGPDHDHNSSIT
jgi:hypothetical protein